MGPVNLCAIFREFLAYEEMLALQDFALRNRDMFRSSTVSSRTGAFVVDESYRRSRILSDTGRFHRLFSERLHFYLPKITRALDHDGLRTADVDHIEAQITASNDGEYFRKHTDNSNHGTRSREIAFVYFFNREPNRFTGGELCVYDESGGKRLITPAQNDVVFFLASRRHEVTTIDCPSKAFINGRFTMNGWIHRRL